jgi:hypothetical protein
LHLVLETHLADVARRLVATLYQMVQPATTSSRADLLNLLDPAGTRTARDSTRHAHQPEA